MTLLVTEPRPAETRRAQAAPGPPVTVGVLDLLTARALGLGPHGATLVRPDGVPVASWWSPPSAAEVGRAMTAFLDGAPPLGSTVDPEA
jgi:hypothetical protein